MKEGRYINCSIGEIHQLQEENKKLDEKSKKVLLEKLKRKLALIDGLDINIADASCFIIWCCSRS